MFSLSNNVSNYGIAQVADTRWLPRLASSLLSCDQQMLTSDPKGKWPSQLGCLHLMVQTGSPSFNSRGKLQSQVEAQQISAFAGFDISISSVSLDRLNAVE